MVITENRPTSVNLPEIARLARRAYVELIAGGATRTQWWTSVIVTASSLRQAERYRQEIDRRTSEGKLPPAAVYLVVPDIEDTRIGSGGATINAVRALIEHRLPGRVAASLEDWWQQQRVLMIHSGGDSRRLPEYSLAGKLFSALPVKTPWGEVSTVFDETLALSTSWAERVVSGLMVASGDVVLTFPAQQLDWDLPGVCGAAMRQPIEVGSQHGVYVLGDSGRVYSFLQKPSAADVRAAGGMFPGECVALDIGLLRFDAALCARLTELAGVRAGDKHWEIGRGILNSDSGRLPVIDLYQHISLALTGQWEPEPDDHPALHAVANVFRGVPFWCSLVDGDFTHIGTTSHFQRLMTEGGQFTELYSAHQRLGAVSPPQVKSAGVIVDSVFAPDSELAAGCLAIECQLTQPVRAGRGSIIHGLSGLPGRLEIPEDTVIHQLPIKLADGRGGVVIRVYGVRDDPKITLAETTSTWLGRPMLGVLDELGIEPEEVWQGVSLGERSLWNARLFPLGSIAEAFYCASWMMGYPAEFSLDQWRYAERLSLATSAHWADTQEISASRTRRMQTGWQMTAVALAESGTDLRPLIAHAPGIAALAETGRELGARARDTEERNLTEAASRHFQAAMFLGQAGLENHAEQARAAAFDCVRRAVDLGVSRREVDLGKLAWRHQGVRVSAPARIDLGGGWSDTPPFCIDWGGTVLNIAIALNGVYPIVATVRRLKEPVIRCASGESGEMAEYRTTEEAMAPPSPGSPLSIPRAALQLTGIVRPEGSLNERLTSLGGGIDIRTEVNLPMGSGLGTSSILAAALIQALAEMAGSPLEESALSDQVMRLEQLLTSGGGWQDQAGGIYRGAKLVMSGPGLDQKLRVQPLDWALNIEAEFLERFVIYYTGIRRLAKDLLAQVVGSYLAREVATVQVLHSIKTLAVEMSYAMREGDWDYLGRLLDRHWELNQVLDPHTTNAPIDALLARIRPYLAGAKLAGAGGGGFLLLLAKGPAEAVSLRKVLREPSTELPGKEYDYGIAVTGMQVERE